MQRLPQHWFRTALTLIPLVFALLHATNTLFLDVVERLDNLIYDARLRASMPQTLSERIVIVAIDEKSLAEIGRWPWGRHKVAALIDELHQRQRTSLIGFDVVFAEPDDSSGLQRLRQLAQTELRDTPGFAKKLDQLQSSLDYDKLLVHALQDRPVALGYYFTSNRTPHFSGSLPQPVMDKRMLEGRTVELPTWNGYGANLDALAQAAPRAGFFNAITDKDGVVRSTPLLAEFQGNYYESLPLAMFRMLTEMPTVALGFPKDNFLLSGYQGADSIRFSQREKTYVVPVDQKLAVHIPFLGKGGLHGGSFRYISAADVLAQRLPADSLKNKIVLIGATAPGLSDLRATPVDAVFPGVEIQANVISALLNGTLLVKPDYLAGFEFVLLSLVGLVLAGVLPRLSAARTVGVTVLILGLLLSLNFYLYFAHNLVLPLASALLMTLTAFAFNMSYGYFFESRSKRELVHLFGTYVPPELVNEMVKDPDRYTMQATSKQLTVMFCDMRGFTKISESMEPTQLQELLNNVFSRLTTLIRSNRGTIDKYMGDCVMAFWGAPVDTPEHPDLAVKTALDIAAAIAQINRTNRARRLPEISVGIGLSTGTMCVGDMGSDVRRSYTVIGDAVNLGARLESLCKIYGVDIVASETTRRMIKNVAWQELDKVKVKGKEHAISVYTPVALSNQLDADKALELKTWNLALKAYRAQDWDQCDVYLLNLLRTNEEKYLYHLYAQRVASMRLLAFDPNWDGAMHFDSK